MRTKPCFKGKNPKNARMTELSDSHLRILILTDPGKNPGKQNEKGTAYFAKIGKKGIPPIDTEEFQAQTQLKTQEKTVT